MYYIGNHLPVSKGYAVMGEMALKLGGNTFAFFTRNPRGGKAKEIDEDDVNELLNITEENGFGKLVAHAPYTMNLCAGKEDVRKFSKEVISDDIKGWNIHQEIIIISIQVHTLDREQKGGLKLLQMCLMRCCHQDSQLLYYLKRWQAKGLRLAGPLKK